MKDFGTWSVFCLLLTSSLFAQSGQLGIAIDDLQFDPEGGSGVKFSSAVAIPGVHIDANEAMRMRPYRTDDGLYLVYVAFDKTAPTQPPSDINYYLYSQPTSGTQRDVFTQYVVVGTPHGDFSDRWTSVRLHLSENGAHNGSVELPVHSFSNSALISVEPDPDAGTVYLSQPDHKISVTAKNSLKGFNINLDGAELTANNDRYWQWSSSNHHYTVAFDNPGQNPPFTLTAAPLNGAAEVQPNLWRSLSAAIGSFRSDQFQDTLSLTVRYNAGLGGNPRALNIPIKVRFRPPWWSAFGFALTGAVLGSLLTLLFPDTWKGQTVGRTVGSALLLAVVVEILGFAMFLSDNSKLVIGGFSLAPTELLPALSLGILVGLLGLKVLDAFKIPLPTR